DRTNHRWGRFRPWLVWSAIPFALMFWVAFTVPPGLSDTTRILYAGGSYALLMVVYTMNNVPYSALMGVMTGNPDERTSLASYRFVAGIGAAFVVQGFTLPLVGKLGGGNDAKGWSMTVGIYAAVAVVFFLITFFTTKERIQPPKDQKSDIRQDFADLKTNIPWFAMFGMVLCVFITLALRGGRYYYYFPYYVDASAMADFVDGTGLIASAEQVAQGGFGLSVLDLSGLVVKPGDDASKVCFSLFNMMGNLISILGILAAKPLAHRFGKKAVFTVGLGAAALIQASFVTLNPEDVGGMFMLQILSCASYGPTIPLLWAMMGDVADYSEWKNKRRSTGFVFAGLVF